MVPHTRISEQHKLASVGYELKKTLRLVLLLVVLMMEEEDLGRVRGGVGECDQIHHIHV